MAMSFNQGPSSPGLEGRACPDQSAAANPASSPHARQALVVTLPGEIDLTNASQVYGVLTQARESGTAVVVADATETTFCDCAGVRALISVHYEAAATGTSLRVAAATSRKVRRILQLTGAGQVLDTYPTLTAALDGSPRAVGADSRPAQSFAGTATCEDAIAPDSDGEWHDAGDPGLRIQRGQHG